MKELLTTEDLAYVLGINVKKINNIMGRGLAGLLPPMLPREKGYKRVWSARAVETWLNERSKLKFYAEKGSESDEASQKRGRGRPRKRG